MIITEQMYERLADVWGCDPKQISRDGENLVITLANGERVVKCSFADAVRNLTGARGEWN